MWNDLTMSERADVIKMAVKAGLRDMKSIRDFYDNSLKYADGGPKKSFDDWYKTVPVDRNDTTNYDLRRAYELAPIKDLESWRTSSIEDLRNGKNHLNSVYEDPNTGIYNFVKSKNHPTVGLELDWYNSKDAADFRSKYDLDTSGDYYRYVPKPDYNITLPEVTVLGSKKYAEGGPKVTLVDNDKVRMSPSGTFSDDNGNIIGDSIVLPEITIRARDDKKHVGEYKSTFNPSGAAEFAGAVLNSPLMLADKGINKLGINGTPVQTTAQRVGETLSPTRWVGTLKSGFKESPWSENNPGLWGDRNIDMMTDLVVGVGLSKVPYSKIATSASNTANRYKYLKTIENAPINSDKLLNDAMLNDLTFVNGAIRNKSALGAKTVEDVVSFTYGLPKGITPKTKLSSLTSNQIYDLVLRDLQRENPNNWFIGVGNSAKNNRYIHMDANSSIIPTTEGFLPTREGFTKVGRYGTPEIWYNKDIPYYQRELSSTPRTVITTKKALGIEDVFENVAHTPKTLKYEDILFGVEPNEFGWYNKVKYTPYKRAPLSNTPYNPSIDPNNLFNIQHKPNFAEGGSIHIAPSKRGTFTAAATKHGMGVQEFASKVLANKDNYSPAMVKKANFARNFGGHKHSLGGYLFI